MARVDFQTLRSQVNIAEVLHLLGFVPSQRRGGQVRGPCPLHPPRGPARRSLSAHLAKKAYQCFHCGSSGNQLDLWAAATRQPLYQAAIDLCEKLNRPVPWLSRSRTGRKKSAPAS